MDYLPVSPYNVVAGPDPFLDGSTSSFELPFSGVNVSVVSPPPRSSTATSVSVSRSASQVLSGPDVATVGVPTLGVVTHTFSRPVDSVGSSAPMPGLSMTLSSASARPPSSYCGYVMPGSMSSSRPAWTPYPPFPYPSFGSQSPYPGFWPYGDPSFGVRPQVGPSSNVSSMPSASVSRSAVQDSPTQNASLSQSDDLRSLFTEFRNSLKGDLESLSSRIERLEAASSVPPSSRASDIDSQVEEDADIISVAPADHEASFLSEDDNLESSVSMGPPVSESNSSTLPIAVTSGVSTDATLASSQAITVAGSTPSTAPCPPPTSVDVESSSEAKSSYADLREDTFSLLRNANVPMASPPRPKKQTSTFEKSCGLAQAVSASHSSFPESNHVSTALQVINEGFKSSAGDKTANKSLTGFGLASFPEFLSTKDHQVHNSTLGRKGPLCERSFATLIGSRPVDGLRLSQSVWAKTESLLRVTSQALTSAEYFLAATGALLCQEEFASLPKVRSFLLQVDKAIGTSQVLLLGSIGNLTLSKRSEILEKSSVSENLKDSLLRSPITENTFGLQFREVQEEISKQPPPVKVSVQVSNDNKRTVTSSSVPQSGGGQPNKKRRVFYRKKSNPAARGSAPKSKPNSSQFGKKTSSST